jgi:AraC family transcriptional regulator
MSFAPDPGESRLLRLRKTTDLHISEIFYPAGMSQRRHRHDGASLSFVVTGSYEERVGRASHAREQAMLIVHPTGESHAVDFASDVRIISIGFTSPALGAIENRSAVLNSSSRCSSRLVAWLGSRLDRELSRSDDASAVAIEGIVAEMLAEGGRERAIAHEKGTPRWLTNSLGFIHDNFAASFELNEVADAGGVHIAHLSRVFRQKMGCTVGEYVRRLRFEYACRQIVESEMRLCEIAHDAGFADQSHLNRTFQTQMGVTPFRYRQLHRNN